MPEGEKQNVEGLASTLIKSIGDFSDQAKIDHAKNAFLKTLSSIPPDQIETFIITVCDESNFKIPSLIVDESGMGRRRKLNQTKSKKQWRANVISWLLFITNTGILPYNRLESYTDRLKNIKAQISNLILMFRELYLEDLKKILSIQKLTLKKTALINFLVALNKFSVSGKFDISEAGSEKSYVHTDNEKQIVHNIRYRKTINDYAFILSLGTGALISIILFLIVMASGPAAPIMLAFGVGMKGLFTCMLIGLDVAVLTRAIIWMATHLNKENSQKLKSWISKHPIKTAFIITFLVIPTIAFITLGALNAFGVFAIYKAIPALLNFEMSLPHIAQIIFNANVAAFITSILSFAYRHYHKTADLKSVAKYDIFNSHHVHYINPDLLLYLNEDKVYEDDPSVIIVLYLQVLLHKQDDAKQGHGNYAEILTRLNEMPQGDFHLKTRETELKAIMSTAQPLMNDFDFKAEFLPTFFPSVTDFHIRLTTESELSETQMNTIKTNNEYVLQKTGDDSYLLHLYSATMDRIESNALNKFSRGEMIGDETVLGLIALVRNLKFTGNNNDPKIQYLVAKIVARYGDNSHSIFKNTIQKFDDLSPPPIAAAM